LSACISVFTIYAEGCVDRRNKSIRVYNKQHDNNGNGNVAKQRLNEEYSVTHVRYLSFLIHFFVVICKTTT